ncbi:hypothetical protein M758_UG162800 [Ceratodon purpureus]|nr:hypothetical protein M758_UG162800 [Ceratodon purpureus]
MISDPHIWVGLQNFTVFHVDTRVLGVPKKIAKLRELRAGQRSHRGKSEATRGDRSLHPPGRSEKPPVLTHAVHLVIFVTLPDDIPLIGVIPSCEPQCCPLRAAINHTSPHGAGQTTVLDISYGAYNVRTIVPQIRHILIPQSAVQDHLPEQMRKNTVLNHNLLGCHGGDEKDGEHGD